MAEMQARLAVATEMLLYGDTESHDPGETSKLPPVTERTYVDKDGNPLDPSQVVDAQNIKSSGQDLPRIGSDDPYVTVPIKRIVNEYAEVIADRDTAPKVYIQKEAEVKSHTLRNVIIAIVVVLVIAGAGVAAWFWLDQTMAEEEAATAVVQQQQAQETEQLTAARRNIEVYQELNRSYEMALLDYEKVGTIVDDFEGYYLVSSKSTRQQYASQCANLLSDLQAQKLSLKTFMDDAQLASDSPYWDMYDKIAGLYDNLITRTTVINDCWNISLSYDNPKSYSSEILAPLTADIKDSKSASMAAFNANRDAAKPTYVEESDS